jgi:hypothetical protein
MSMIYDAQRSIQEECAKTKTARGLVGALYRGLCKVAEDLGYDSRTEVGMGQEERTGRWYVWCDAIGHTGICHEFYGNAEWYMEIEFGTRMVAYRG